MRLLECRNCSAQYDLSLKPGSRYYCPRCMNGEPYGFRMSKLLGQMIRQLTALEEQRAKANREIENILTLAKNKGVRPRDLNRLRGLCWVNDPKTRDIYVQELTRIRSDITQPEVDLLPGMDATAAPETPIPALPGMVEASVTLPGM